MGSRKIVRPLALLLLLLLVGGVVLAQGTPAIGRWIIGGGGATATGGNVSLSSALGQAAAGPSSGDNVAICAGFWCGGAVEHNIHLPLVVKNFFISPYEPNNRAAQAYGPLQRGVAYQAYPDDTEDWYYFNLPSTANVTVEVTNFTGGDGRLMVYAESDTTNPVSGGYWGAGGPTMTVNPSNLSPGKYYVRVYTGGSTNTTTLYTLTVTY